MYLFWAFQNEIWNEVAMKLRFSRIAEQRKCSISFVTSGNLAGKREAVHFVPNPWDFWRKWNLGSDLRWIPHWTHLCGAFGRLWRKRTWIDWGRSCLRWIVSTGAEICSDKFMFKFVWNIVRIEVGWWWRFAMELAWVHNGVFDENTLLKFMRRLVPIFWKCIHMYNCIFWHKIAGNLGRFSKRTAGCWVDYDMGSRPRRAELLWCRFVKDKLMLKFEWNMVQIEVVMMMTFCNGIGMISWRCIWRKYFLWKFTMALVFMFWKCSHMYICIFWHNFAGDMRMFSKRTAGGWVDYDMGQIQIGGQNSFDVEKGTFFAR